MNDVFDISKFNVINDDKNYYVFRALNNADRNDMEKGISSDEDGHLVKIRTDRERYEEINGKARYDENSEISLEEVWNHIKMRYSKETNCISLSSNANVSIDYGRSYNEQYVMIKVPKEGNEHIYNAGQYMLREVSLRIDKEIEKIDKSSELFQIIKEIENSDNYQGVKEIAAKVFKRAKSEGKYIGTNIRLE